ncbi:MAG: hypothetical protein E5V63_01225 [Mesorhizobium sp.]|nr:MAG: hypothetical protein E5V63_01225 [Mesorhizobium sp.]
MPETDRVALARYIIEYGSQADEPTGRESMAADAQPLAADALGLAFPDGTKPAPIPFPDDMHPDNPLPEGDVLVVTWTVAEHQALADVITPNVPSRTWANYRRRYDDHYRPLIRNGAPAIKANRLGSWCASRIADKKLICFKSELHLNQDGIETGEGTATLPVKDLFRQLIDEVKPKLVITVGTAGATFPPGAKTQLNGMECSPHQLGDVVITRGAKFRLSQEFRKEAFAKTRYKCETFNIPTGRLAAAAELLNVNASKLAEPAFGPPHTGYQWPNGVPIPGLKNAPDLKIDGRDFPAFHPILTTDFFEFGTSTNALERDGCGVEMGDAVLGMVIEEMKAGGQVAPNWLVIRNASDPQINGTLPNRDTPGVDPQLRRNLDMQAHWAVWYYETYGYWTSVNSAIAVWAMVA